MAEFAPIVASMKSRRTDKFGSGQFGASRKGRRHNGLDIVSVAGENVFSPIEGQVIREAVPYADDPFYRGVVIRGDGAWSGYEVKVFYVDGLFCGYVTPGTIVGLAQDLTLKYPGITNHVHMEVRRSGTLLDPSDMYAMCF